MSSADCGQQRAVGHHRAAVGRQRAQRRPGTPGRAGAPGLSTGTPSSSAALADRAGDQPAAPPGGGVGAGDHADQLVADAATASSAGSATSGVPAKTTRISSARARRVGCGRDLDGRAARAPNHSDSRIAFIAALRASGSSRSTNSTPSRWSVSCWIARASSSVPSIVTGSPCMSKPRATTDSARRQSKASSGSDRQPSGPSWISSERSRSGLTRWPSSPSTYQVNTRSPTPICGAASRRRGLEHGVGEVLDQPCAARRRSRPPGGRRAQHRVAEQADRLDGHGTPRVDGAVASLADSRLSETGAGRPGPGRRRACGPSAPAAARRARADSAAPSARGTRTHDPAAPRRSTDGRPGPSTSAPRAAAQQGQRVVDRPGLAGERGEPGGRGQVGRRPLGDLALGEARPGPSAPAPAARGAPGRRRRPPGHPGAGPAPRVGPAAQRLLGGAQVGPGEQQPGVEQHHRGVAAVGHRLGARRRDHDRRLGRRPSASTRSPLERAHRDAGEGPAQLLGGAARRRAPARAARGRRTSAQAQAGSAVAAPAAASAGGRARRAAAGRRSGQRAGVRQRSQARHGGVAARGVCTSTGPVLQAGRGARRAPRLGSRAARARGSRSSSRSVAAGDADRGRARRSTSRGARRARGPSRCGARYSASTLRAKPPTSAAAPSALGAQQQHLAGVGVRRPRLGVQVVAVVPDRDQPEVVHRRERAPRGCRPRSGTAPRRTARKRGSARPGRRRRSARRAGPRRGRSVSAASSRSTSRWSGTQTSAPRPDGVRSRPPAWASSVGQSSPGARRPHRPRRLRRAASCVEQRAGRARGPPRPAGRPSRSTSGGGAGGDGCLLGGRVPRRDGQPQHVGAGAGVPLGHRARSARRRRG